MRAVGVRVYGGPEALEVVDIPETHAGAGQVRIRVHAATINPTDTYVRLGLRAKADAKTGPPPYIPGMDAAGVIDEIGDIGRDGTGLTIGDRVMAIVRPTGSHGAYSSSIVVPVRSVARAPAGTSHAEAATLPMNALTARLTLDKLGLKAGQTLAVTGAAGCYGGYVVQLAKIDGLQVIADASDTDRDLVGQLGADLVLARGEAFADCVRAALPDGVDGLADGGVQGESVLAAIRDGGAFGAVRGWEGPAPRGIVLHDNWVSEYAQEQEKLDQLRQHVEDGLLTLRIAQVYPPEQAPEAHRRLEAGGVRGRLVLAF